MSNFYFDLTPSTHPATIRALLEIASPDHLLFGSDCPFAKQRQVQSAIENLAQLQFDPATLDAINRGNATKLFGRVTGA